MSHFVSISVRIARYLSAVLVSSVCIVALGILPLHAATLDLPEVAAPSDTVPQFSDSYIQEHWSEGTYNNNDKIIFDLTQKSLLANIFKIAKYVLGGVFMLFAAVYVVELIISNGNDEEVKHFRDRVLYAFIGFATMALAEPLAYTFFVARDGGNFLTNQAALQQSVQIASFSLRSAVRFVQYVLGALALLFMGSAAFKMIMANGDAETIKVARKTIVWATLGLIIAGGAGPVVDTVLAPTSGDSGSMAQIASSEFLGLTPEEQHARLLAMSRVVARAEVLKYVKYFQTFIAAIAVSMIFLAGAKLVMAGGNEEVTGKETKTLTWIFLGLAVILLTEVFVSIFMPESYLGLQKVVDPVTGQFKIDPATGTYLQKVVLLPDRYQATDLIISTPGTAELQSFSEQMGGITNFMISFVGAISVLALIVGAIFFATAALNEEQAQKGKKIILAAALGIVITVSAYALVNTVFSRRPFDPDMEASVNLTQ